MNDQPASASSAASHVLRGPCDLIAGSWHPIPGSTLISRNPAFPEQVVYSGAPVIAHVDLAVGAARQALPAWSRLDRSVRFGVLCRFAEICKQRSELMAGLLCDEIGKVMWEAKAEAGILANKVDITLDAAPEGGLARVTPFEMNLSSSRVGRCTFRPHGVMAVLGPFNFPAHLPNGHIVPALAMGNTVVLKPSDKAPAVGQQLIDWLDEALRLEGVHIPGVVNLVQGGAEIAGALVKHPGIDGIAFTGSWSVGRRILESNLDHPGRIVALELGGNNATLVMPDADLRLAAIELVRSAFTTTGQRCTCTRRAIVHEGIAERLIPLVCKITSNLIRGQPRAAHPVFLGPINNDAARQSVLAFQDRAARAGAEMLIRGMQMDTPGSTSKGYYISPGVMRVDRFSAAGVTSAFDPGCDEEVFGPLLRISVVKDFDEGIEQVNASRFGLAAAIFTTDTTAAERFLNDAKAGCININAGTAGASSKLPFGGFGLSGNHRPAGSFALDYCAVPVASMVESSTSIATPEGMRVEDGWVR